MGLFKREIAKLEAENPNIVLVAATNYAGQIDPAVLRAGRFSRKLYIGLPDEAARMRMFSGKMMRSANALEGGWVSQIEAVSANERPDGFVVFDGSVDERRLAQITDGWSGAEIDECLKDVRFAHALKELETGECRPVTQDDLVRHIMSYQRDRAI